MTSRVITTGTAKVTENVVIITMANAGMPTDVMPILHSVETADTETTKALAAIKAIMAKEDIIMKTRMPIMRVLTVRNTPTTIG